MSQKNQLNIENVLSVMDNFRVNTNYQMEIFVNVEKTETVAQGCVLGSILVSLQSIQDSQDYCYQLQKAQAFLILIKKQILGSKER